MAQARRTQGAGRRRGGSGFSGWTGLFIGLVLGVGLAALVWKVKTRPGGEPVAREHKRVPLSAAEDAPEKEADSSPEFTFYDKLKSFEVVVPEKDREVRRDLKPVPETRPGTYVLQAGSYRNFADADRIRAQLALQGVESKVQKVTVDTDTWHRVRVGPITSLAELNRLRAKLRQADVDALVIRVGD